MEVRAIRYLCCRGRNEFIHDFLLPPPFPLLPFREGDRGSRITLIGLGANIILTSAKGAAGVLMNSAALLADAGHSLSGEYDHWLNAYQLPFFLRSLCASRGEPSVLSRAPCGLADVSLMT